MFSLRCWQVRVVWALISVSAALVLGVCDNGNPSPDGGDDGGRDTGTDDADTAEDVDNGGYPLLVCEPNENNMMTCMLRPPDGGPGYVNGTWCGDDCRFPCIPPNECPPDLVCHRDGSTYLCMRE